MPRLRASLLLLLAAVPAGAVARGDDGPARPAKTPAEWIEALRGGDAEARARAARALGRLPNPDKATWEALAGALRDGEPAVRVQAAIALARPGGSLERALPVLLAGRRADDEEVRGDAEAAWGRIGPGIRAAIPYLRQQYGGRNNGGMIVEQQPNGNRMNPQARGAAALGQAGLEALPAILDALAVPAAANLAPIGMMMGQDGNVLINGRSYSPNGDPESRFRAFLVEALAKLGDPAVPTLVEAMAVRRAEVRDAAAEALGRIGTKLGEPAARALVRALDDRDAAVRLKAVDALAKATPESDEVARALVAALNHRDPAVRRGAVPALRRVGPGRAGAVPALNAALDDPDAAVRVRAADLLADLDGQSRRPLAALVASLEDRDPAVRQQAAAGLRRLGARAGEVEAELIELTGGDDPAVRVLAAVALAGAGPRGKERSTAVLSALVTSGDPVTRLNAAEALWDMGQPAEAIPLLVASLDIREGNLSFRANQILGRIGPKTPEVIPALVDALPRATPEGRRRILSILQQTGSATREAAPAIARLLADGDQGVRMTAASILSQVDRLPDEVLPPVLEALKAGDAASRGQVMMLLGRFSGSSPAVIAALIELLGNPDAMVRARVVDAIRQTAGQGNEAAIEALARAAGDADENVSRQATSALIQVGGRSRAAIPPLAALLRSDRPGARLQALQAIRSLPEVSEADRDTLIPGLVAAMADRNARVRDLAGIALAQSGPKGVKAVAPAVLEALKGADLDARAHALQSFQQVIFAAPDLARAIRPEIEAAAAGPTPAIRSRAVAILRQLGDVGEPRTRALMDAALRDDDPTVRVEAAQALAGLPDGGGDAAIPALIALLDGSPADVRIHAAQALGQAGARAVPAIPALARMAEDADPKVRGQAAIGLFRMGPEGRRAGRTGLLLALREGDINVRSHAMSALREAGGDEAGWILPELMAMLYTPSTDRKEAVVSLIASFGAKAQPAIPALVDLLKSQDFTLRRAAVQALRQVGPEGSKAAVPMVIAGLKGDDEQARVQALQLLNDLDVSAMADVIPALAGMLSESQPFARNQAAQALARMGPAGIEAARPALMPMLDDPQVENRLAAAQALVLGGPAEAAAVRKSLMGVLGEPNAPPFQRARAAAILVRLGGEGEAAALPVLLEGLRGSTGDRGQALAVLRNATRIEPDKVVPALVEILDNGEQFARNPAAELIARIGPPARAAIPALDRALGRDPRNSAAAPFVDALARFGAEGVPPLVRALGSTDGPNRLSVIRALGQVGPPAREAVPALIGLLSGDDDEPTRQAVARSLRLIGPDAAAALARAVGAGPGSDPTARRDAARALAAFEAAARPAVPALLEALKDPDAGVRGDAAAALATIRGDAVDGAGPLEEALRRGDPEGRRAAARALARVREVPEPLLAALGDALQASDRLVRVHAAEALGRDPGRAGEAVATLIRSVGDRGVRAGAIDALDRLGPAAKDAVPALAGVLDADDATNDVIRAAHTLARVGGEAAIPPLRQALGRINPRFRPLIVVALAQAGPAGADLLPGLLAHDDPAVRTMAVRQIGQRADASEPLRAVLGRALDDRDPKVRSAAIQAIGHLGSPGSGYAPRLVPLLAGPDPVLRVEAAIALARVEGKPSGPALEVLRAAAPWPGTPGYVGTGLMSPPDGSAVADRWRVVEALGRAGPAEIPLLIRALGVDDHCRLKAAEALARFGAEAKPALPALVAASGSLPWPARARVAAAIARIDPAGDPAAATVPTLVDALRAPALEPGPDSPFVPVHLGDQNAIRKYRSGTDSEATPDFFTTYPAGITQLLPVVDLAALRREVVAALGLIGPRARDAAAGPLEAIGRDEADPARAAAVEALARIAPAPEAAPPANPAQP